MTSGLGALALLLTTGVLQLWALLRMSPRKPVGDEGEYLHRHATFIRVPLMHWLSHGQRQSEGALRAVMALSGVLAAAAVGAAGWLIAEGTGAVVALLILLLLPERLILNNHIWPDVVLSLWASSICLVLVSPATPVQAAALLGVLTALSILTRIEQVILLPVLTWVLLPDAGQVEMALLWLPALGSLAVLTLLNYRRSGVALPDNTWLFNLQLAVRETHNKTGSTKIEALISQQLPQWRKTGPEEWLGALWSALLGLGRRPLRFISGAVLRLWSLLGPDSFISSRLLPSTGRAYPSMPRRQAFCWKLALWGSFPLLVSLLVFLNIQMPQPPPRFIWPTLASLMITATFHSRTRFRLSLVPGFALWAAYLMGSNPAMLLAEISFLTGLITVLTFVMLLLQGRGE